MKFIFLGGSGRSGTSALAERLRVSDDICSFLDVELRILSEPDGIPDLFWNLVEAYSPQRAALAVQRFCIAFEALLDEAPGSLGLRQYISEEDWHAVLRNYLHSLSAENTPARLEPKPFFEATARLIQDIGQLAVPTNGHDVPLYFLEKTPHSLLRLRLLARLPVLSEYLHVHRDPRLVAKSITKMSWGPTKIADAANWVQEYYREYFRVLDWAGLAKIRIRNIWIEEIAMAPRTFAQKVASELGIEIDETVFDDISPETLLNSALQLDASERQQLNLLLLPIVKRLGYSADSVGALCPDRVPQAGLHGL